MTSPYSDFLDSQTMKLIHCKFEIRGHSRKDNKTTIRPKLLQYNSNRKKFYQHSLFVIKDKQTNKMTMWKVSKPPKHLIEPYEIDKTAFTDKLNHSIMEDLNNQDKPELVIDKRKPLTEKQRTILLAYKRLKQ